MHTLNGAWQSKRQIAFHLRSKQFGAYWEFMTKANIVAGCAALIFFSSALIVGQSNTGELRVRVTDPSGSPVRSAVELVSEANEFHKTFATDDAGNVVAKRL